MGWFNRVLAFSFLLLVVAAVALIGEGDPVSPAGGADQAAFRYTDEGWIPVSELVAAPHAVPESIAERIPPMTIATLQLLASLLALLMYDRPRPRPDGNR